MARNYACAVGFMWSLALVVFLMAACGCSRWNWRGKGYSDQDGTWARKMRPPADEKQLSGLDARAQDIERDLGVR